LKVKVTFGWGVARWPVLQQATQSTAVRTQRTLLLKVQGNQKLFLSQIAGRDHLRNKSLYLDPDPKFKIQNKVFFTFIVKKTKNGKQAIDPDPYIFQNPGSGSLCISKPWILIPMYFKTLDPDPHKMDADAQP